MASALARQILSGFANRGAKFVRRASYVAMVVAPLLTACTPSTSGGGESFQQRLTGVAPNTLPPPPVIYSLTATQAQKDYVVEYCKKQVPNDILNMMTYTMVNGSPGPPPSAQGFINQCLARYLPESALVNH
jgi:hypothetical protein